MPALPRELAAPAIFANVPAADLTPAKPGDPLLMPLIKLKVNDKPVEAEVVANELLVTFLRERLGLTGTHVGCDTSQCGACTIHVDGVTVKSCAMLAVQADGASVTTIEGLARGDALHPMQQAFSDHHGLQCGFCTPGMIMAAVALACTNPAPSEAQVKHALEGNLCRCTGYRNIIAAVQAGAKAMAEPARS